jgi:hypothetical protein
MRFMLIVTAILTESHLEPQSHREPQRFFYL